MKKTLMVGPVTGTVTGQQVAFLQAIAGLDNSVVIDNVIVNIYDAIRYWLQVLCGILVTDGHVYITTSRSFLGFWLRDFPVFICAFLSRRAIINHVHGNDFAAFREKSDPLTRRFLDFFYSRHHRTIVSANRIADNYKIYSKVRVQRILNCFDESLLLINPEQKFRCMDSIEVLYLSNFIPEKGYIKLVDAVCLLTERGHEINLTMCGSTQFATNPRIILHYLEGVESKFKNITVLPPVGGSDKRNLLSKAHLMVLPTRYPTEASPISLIEGLASGCFVITTDQGGILELIDGFRASITEDDAEKIASAIVEYINVPDKKSIALHNSRLARRKYAPESFRDNVRKIIDEE